MPRWLASSVGISTRAWDGESYAAPGILSLAARDCNSRVTSQSDSVSEGVLHVRPG